MMVVGGGSVDQSLLALGTADRAVNQTAPRAHTCMHGPYSTGLYSHS